MTFHILSFFPSWKLYVINIRHCHAINFRYVNSSGVLSLYYSFLINFVCLLFFCLLVCFCFVFVVDLSDSFKNRTCLSRRLSLDGEQLGSFKPSCICVYVPTNKVTLSPTTNSLILKILEKSDPRLAHK